ncbi:MAG: methyltransferase [Planctomycetes bacterium]|nr:methyltransferase [Planctomycetota bacterium]
MKQISKHTRGLLKDFVPILFADEHYFAVAKPPRVDLETAPRKHGPRLIELVVGASKSAKTGSKDDTSERLKALILPERHASGVALFARTDEAAHRFAGMARSGKLQFSHVAVTKGKPPRTKIAIKPERGDSKSSGRGKNSLKEPARIEVLDSKQERHVARCVTRAAAFEEIRKAFRLAGLSIDGDEFVTTQHRDVSKTKWQRKPLVHLEQLDFPHPFKSGGQLNLRATIPGPFAAAVRTGSIREVNLYSALSVRLPALLEEDSDCMRLFSGRHEGISGLLADKYADVIVLEAQRGKFQGNDEDLRDIAAWYVQHLDAQTVYLKRSAKLSDGATGKDQPIELIHGKSVDEVSVLSKGTKFIVKPGQGLSSGLFLDHRENRARVARLANGKKLLNLFAYTCGFSVAAAREGAATTSVDLSIPSLEWGKRNFAENGIDLDGHVFICSDAFDYFKRATRQKKRFDVIVIDPPSFARTKKPKRTFEVRKNLVDLIAGALPLLTRGGHMLVATNHRELPIGWLIEQVEYACDKYAAAPDGASRSVQITSKPKLPLDFSADRALQKTIIARFE